MSLPDPLSCFAATAPGIEGILAGELQALGIAVNETEAGGAAFVSTAQQLGDALLQLRTANRITLRIASFRARSFAELERHARQVAWGDVISPERVIHFRVTSKKSRLYHQDAIAERLERVVAVAVAGVRAVRPPLAAEAMERDVSQVPEVQRIIVRVWRDEFVLSADAAGALLHMRGWRQATAKAPLRETLAAGLLLACGWDPALPLFDPFCGAGTIPIEAALIARRIAPGRDRRFAVEAWPGLPHDLIDDARRRAVAAERPLQASIGGADRDAGAIAASISNAERAGVAGDISFCRATISDLAPDPGQGWLITNPPYGARIGERDGLRNLYATLGQALRRQRPAWHLAMLSADRMLERQLGMPLVEALRTSNGGIPVRVMRSG